MSKIKLGDPIILKFNDGDKYFCTTVSKTNFRLRKGLNVPLQELVDKEFGSVFTVDTKHFVPHDPSKSLFQMVGIQSESGGDNRNLPASADAQSLSFSKIVKLKQQGTEGKEIVGALVDNSDTFASKTEFSQEKYLRKKAKKYMPTVQILKPTARTISTAYYHSLADIIGFVRPEVFAHLLTAANVHAGSNVVVAGACGGMLCGAVLERLGGSDTGPGRALLLHATRTRPALPVLKHFGAHVKRKLDSAALGSDAARAWVRQHGPGHALLFAARLDPRDVLLPALSLLAPAAPFAVFCHFAEPLGELQQELLRTRVAVDVQLSSTWYRETQVLPQRTHPTMSMDNNAGYVLTGIAVAPPPLDPVDSKRPLDATTTTTAAAAATAAAASTSTTASTTTSTSTSQPSKKQKTE